MNSNKKNKKSPSKRRPKGKSDMKDVTISNSVTGLQMKSAAGIISAPQVNFASLQKSLITSEFKDGKKRGLRMKGLCPTNYVLAANAAATNEDIFAEWGAEGTTFGGIGVSPHNIFLTGSPEETTSLNYRLYRFKKLGFYMQSLIQSNSGGNYTFGAVDDGAFDGADITSPADVLKLDGAYGTAVWVPLTGSDQTRNLGGSSQDWFYIDADIDADSGLRQSIQQVIVGRWNYWPNNSATGVAILNVGVAAVWIDYELELLDPIGVFDIAGPLLKEVVMKKGIRYCRRSRPPKDVKQQEVTPQPEQLGLQLGRSSQVESSVSELQPAIPSLARSSSSQVPRRK